MYKVACVCVCAFILVYMSVHAPLLLLLCVFACVWIPDYVRVPVLPDGSTTSGAPAGQSDTEGAGLWESWWEERGGGEVIGKMEEGRGRYGVGREEEQDDVRVDQLTRMMLSTVDFVSHR